MAKKQILVGEDSSVIQNLTKKILSSQNFEIDSAKNGEKVLAMLEEKTYNLVLLDINMPKKNGMECIKELRESKSPNKDIPVVAITGNAAGYSEEEFYAAGFTEYLLKPLDFDNLVEIVKKHTS